MSEPLLPENDWALLTLLPEPSNVLDMRRNDIMGDAVGALSGHFETNPDVLVGTRGFVSALTTTPTLPPGSRWAWWWLSA